MEKPKGERINHDLECYDEAILALRAIIDQWDIDIMHLHKKPSEKES